VIPFAESCEAIARVLAPSFRRDVLAGVAKDAADYRTALLRLRDRMRAHVWNAGAHTVNLSAIVRAYDEQTREDGFHVLNDWDGKADSVSPDIIPVDVLHYVAGLRGGGPVDTGSMAILLDYYFFHLLCLLSLRIWDDGDPDDNLVRLDDLLRLLQGEGGGGQRFVDDAATMILIATSHFEVVEIGYEKLLARVRSLHQSHQTTIALAHAASIGCHLRFGFEATYGRDTIVMRDDNVADYPWLCFALELALREFARLHDAGQRDGEYHAVVEKILNGLSSDARAFVGEAPAALSESERPRAAIRELFSRYRVELIEAFDRLRPLDETYSPLSLFFNFSHNILKGTVVDVLLRGRRWDVSFDELLNGTGAGPAALAARLALATTLMDYARNNPDRIRGRLMPVIVYDPQAGREFFSATLRKLRE
jgi:hypothetical protein